MQGKLKWKVAYYEKAKLNPALKMKPGVDHDLPKELQDHPELKVETTAADTAEEADATRTPPDPRYPSGIFSIVIHQINGLERQNLKGKTGKDREGQAGQDTDDPAEETGNLPSSCEFGAWTLQRDLLGLTRSLPRLRDCSQRRYDLQDSRQAILANAILRGWNRSFRSRLHRGCCPRRRSR